MTIEKEIKRETMKYFKDKHKVNLWYGLYNPYLMPYFSPKEVVREGKGNWLLEECKRAIF